jgi:hypothetical protein
MPVGTVQQSLGERRLLSLPGDGDDAHEVEHDPDAAEEGEDDGEHPPEDGFGAGGAGEGGADTCER